MREPIPKEILEARVGGVNLVPGTLRDQLSPDGTLLVFLRYFGCIFCRETVIDLRRVVETRSDYPAVLFFFQGTPTEGRLFLRRFWPEARAVADPELGFYHAFGVKRGSVAQMLSPGVLITGQLRARSKGVGSGPRSGDIWMMPGVMLVRDETVVWSHDFRHQADHPDFDRVPQLAGAG